MWSLGDNEECRTSEFKLCEKSTGVFPFSVSSYQEDGSVLNIVTTYLKHQCYQKVEETIKSSKLVSCEQVTASGQQGLGLSFTYIEQSLLTMIYINDGKKIVIMLITFMAKILWLSVNWR